MDCFRGYQRLVRAYNLPKALIEPAGAKLIPLYLLIESLSIQKGYCWAGDEAMAKELGYVKTTVMRQRQALEDLCLIIREGSGQHRRLVPWWRWADSQAKVGNTSAVDQLLLKVAGRSYQSEIFPSAPVDISEDAIASHITERYGARSFFELSPTEQAAWAQSWKLTHIGDLCFLFEQESSPRIYALYQKLSPVQRAKIEKHAPAYAMSNRGDPDKMMNLSRYLDPYQKGWATRIRKPSPAAGSQGRGMNHDQAQYLRRAMRGGA